MQTRRQSTLVRKQAFGPECSPEALAPVQRGVVGDITAGLPLGRWSEEVSRAVLTRQELRWDKLGLIGHEREVLRREVISAHRQHIEARDRFYPFTSFPYVEFFSEANGRVVLDPGSDIDVHGDRNKLKRRRVKTPEELFADEEQRAAAFSHFMAGGAVVHATHDACTHSG